MFEFIVQILSFITSINKHDEDKPIKFIVIIRAPPGSVSDRRETIN